MMEPPDSTGSGDQPEQPPGAPPSWAPQTWRPASQEPGAGEAASGGGDAPEPAQAGAGGPAAAPPTPPGPSAPSGASPVDPSDATTAGIPVPPSAPPGASGPFSLPPAPPDAAAASSSAGAAMGAAGGMRARPDPGAPWRATRPATEPLPHVAPATGAPGPGGDPPAPGGRAGSPPRWKAAVLVAAVAASGLIGGVVGHELDSDVRSTGALAPVPAAGGSSVALPVEGFADLYKRMLPTVVEIEADGQGSESTGSGVVVDTAGTVVTAAHVVGDRDAVTVILSDGRQLQGSVAGRDQTGDLAVVKIKDAPNDLTAAPLADSDQLAVGQTTAALGAPFGLRNSLTVGVISGLNRTFSPNPAGPPLRGLVQTDAAINPGSSGGPLFDAAGRVIGINTAIKSPVGGSVGVGFAVPVNQVRESLPLLTEGKAVERPFLGIEGRPGGRGVEVVNVTDGSSAKGAGIVQGDVITGIAGRKVLTVDDIAAELSKHKVGDKVDVTVIRGGSEKKLSVELKSLPATRS